MDWGKLGHGDGADNNIPVKIILDPGVRIKQVSCGVYHTAFITDIGNIYTLGNNGNGQLGLGHHPSTSIPIQIPGFNNVLQVSCGDTHTAFITEEGTIYTFGSNDSGQLGVGDKIDSAIPIQIIGFDNVTQVSCGHSHTVFLTAEGKTYAFGSNKIGQLGIKSNYENISIPVRIPLINKAIQIACGFDTTAFVIKGGDVYITGNNIVDELGLGDRNERTIPTLINMKDQVLEVACGFSHMAFLTTNNEIYICGISFPNNPHLHFPLKIETKLHRIDNFVDIIHVSCGDDFVGFIKK